MVWVCMWSALQTVGVFVEIGAGVMCTFKHNYSLYFIIQDLNTHCLNHIGLYETGIFFFWPFHCSWNYQNLSSEKGSRQNRIQVIFCHFLEKTPAVNFLGNFSYGIMVWVFLSGWVGGIWQWLDYFTHLKQVIYTLPITEGSCEFPAMC